MKRFFVMLAFAWICVGACVAQMKIENAQLDEKTLHFTIVCSCPQTKDVLFRAAKEWLSTNVKDFQKNLQYEDKESGTIKVKMTSGTVATKKRGKDAEIRMKGRFEYVTTVTVKDGKYRVKTDNLMAYWNETLVYGYMTDDLGSKRLDGIGYVQWTGDATSVNGYKRDVEALMNGIANQAQSQAADDDF